MNAFQDHALADTRHADRYPSAVSATARRRRRMTLGGVQARLGVLLVEAGLHLLTRRPEAAPRFSSRPV